MLVCLTLGPMKSGKTTGLWDTYAQWRTTRTGNIFCVTHLLDTREQKRHDGITCGGPEFTPVDRLSNLIPMLHLSTESTIVLVDEIQWFDLDDTITFLKYTMAHQITVYLAGLDLDCTQTPFPTSAGLQARCSNIRMLRATCDLCGEPKSAIYTCRDTVDIDELSGGQNFLLVGNRGYFVTCRHCYTQ